MKIAILGAGNMASAIVGAVAKSKRMSPEIFCAYDKSEQQLEKISKVGALTSASLFEAASDADFILLSVKPQDLEKLIGELKEQCPNYAEKKYVTICAGISTSYLCDLLGAQCPVIRVMPNAPMMLGCGATAISRNLQVTDKDYSKICGIFSFGGEIASIPEEQMNAIISVNSSSPAYFYEFVRIMIEYAKSKGIDENVARSMAQNAMLGAAKMLISSNKSPEELISMIKSKKGTTEAALDSLSESGFEKIISDAMEACTIRAGELGK